MRVTTPVWFLFFALSVACLFLIWPPQGRATEQRADDVEAESPYVLNDPIGRLGRRIERGEVRLEFDRNRFGYLPSLLEHLDVNADSQLLVFSKTSLQATLVSPETPRAIFFNDNVSIGSVPRGEVFELAGLDPTEGVVFYTLNTEESAFPRFIRRSGDCQICHRRELMVTTVYPKPDGSFSLMGVFFAFTDQSTPFNLRWGGWYVTGTHGAQRHMGNAFAPDPDHPFTMELEGSQNLTSLEGRFDTTHYLMPTSDIVALMTLGHQARMTNLIAQANREFRAARFSGSLEARKEQLGKLVAELVVHMVSADEEPLRSAISGVSTFTDTFPSRGPADRDGRSLRDFDLQTRLFRYPVSYMIYSEVFEGLDSSAKEQVYRRLYAVLKGEDPDGRFSNIGLSDRRAAFEILRDTKRDLPEYWTNDRILETDP